MIHITKADVGRRVRLRNGYELVLTGYIPSHHYPVKGRNSHNSWKVDGRNTNGTFHPYDIVAFIDEESCVKIDISQRHCVRVSNQAELSAVQTYLGERFGWMPLSPPARGYKFPLYYYFGGQDRVMRWGRASQPSSEEVPFLDVFRLEGPNTHKVDTLTRPMVFHADVLEVGCQRISRADALKIADLIKKEYGNE